MVDELDQTVGERLRAGGWERQADGLWRVEVDEGRLVGTIEAEAGQYTARVLRHPTGPSGADPVEAHGPTPFDDPADAVDYVEANLGLGG